VGAELDLFPRRPQEEVGDRHVPTLAGGVDHRSSEAGVVGRSGQWDEGGDQQGDGDHGHDQAAHLILQM
jgi:hypothetical protein